MHAPSALVPRRQFVKSLAIASAGLAVGRTIAVASEEAAGGKAPGEPAAASSIKLGIDNFAVRAMGWKAPALVEYAASLKLDSLESFDAGYLTEVKSQAAERGLQIHLGTWSICPTSKVFRNTWGTAEEHLDLAIRTAAALGSPVIRVVLGNGQDRLTEGGIAARIRDTVQVCKALRSSAMDSGVKIAVENHAGDMQARELAALIEEAGKDFVGANMDSGNAAWALEHPLDNLEILGPYALTTSLRDSAVWESELGATVQWTAMGDGDMDLEAYFKRFVEICPNVPVHIETISGFNREIPYLAADFWQAWPQARAADFARFLALAKKGKPRPPHEYPADQDRKLAEQGYQKAEVERSIKYCKEELGLGQKRDTRSHHAPP
jgi:sugar phosphate isomerase/epimerase